MKIAFVFGTRPEAIKLAPVVIEARRRPGIAALAVSTGQHRELLRSVLGLFRLEPDIDLDLMQPNQTLAGLNARALAAMDGVLAEHAPDAVFVQGDTTTAMAAALAAFYRRIPVAHVEAGLRSDRLDAPFPEEANRRIISQVARWHLAPTDGSRANLLRDAVDRLGGDIEVVGNTVIDALLLAVEAVRAHPPQSPLLDAVRAHRGRFLLATGHRRESFGEPLREMCLALRDLADAHPDLLVAYPVHPNPNVLGPVREILGGHGRILLAAPAEYPEFVALMEAAHLIVTDSGGVQEEAPALGKPVLVTRDVTERPEAVAAGAALLVGARRHALFAAADRLLRDADAYARMAQVRWLYGDGKASARCLDAVLR